METLIIFLGVCIVIFLVFVFRPQDYLYGGKTIFSGLESSGKSLMTVRVLDSLILRNSKWIEQGLIPRPIYTNIAFSDERVSDAKALGVKILMWSELEELLQMRECDVIIDEIGTYFDAVKWDELSIDVRRWIAQTAKQGIEIYGTAQDFAQVHKAFRRLTNRLYHISKIMGSRRPSKSKPPVKKVWGLCVLTSLNPQSYDEDTDKFASKGILDFLLKFSFFTINARIANGYDTQQKILESKPIPFKHIVRICTHPECKYKHVFHR